MNKMTSAQVVETSVTNNSSFQNYPHPDDHTIRTTENIMASVFLLKPLVSDFYFLCIFAGNSRKH